MKFLEYLSNLNAEIYLSPGYLLLANLYQNLIPFQNEPCFSGLNLKLEAFQALQTAKLLENDSEAMFNNAYQGKSITEASHGKINTLFQAQLKFLDHISLAPWEITIATDRAQAKAELIKNKLRITHPQTQNEEIVPEEESWAVLTW